MRVLLDANMPRAALRALIAAGDFLVLGPERVRSRPALIPNEP